jgi:hypothetical protein
MSDRLPTCTVLSNPKIFSRHLTGASNLQFVADASSLREISVASLFDRLDVDEDIIGAIGRMKP